MYDNRHHAFDFQYNHKLFAHVNTWSSGVFDYLSVAKPKIVKFLDPNEDAVRQVRTLLPDALLIFRHFVDVQNLGGNFTQAHNIGKAFAAELMQFNVVNQGICDLVEGYNEVLGETAADDLHLRYAKFQTGLYDGLSSAPVEPIALNFGTGNMSGQQIMDLYSAEVLTLYRWLGFHEYDFPTMDRLHNQGLAEGNGGQWLALRYRRIMEPIIAALGDNWSVVITECGMTQGVHAGAQDVGYNYPDNTVPGIDYQTPIPPQDYYDTLRWYSDELMKDSYVAGACMFVTGWLPPWESFETIPAVTNLIIANQEEIENGEVPMPENEPFVLDDRDDESLDTIPRIETWQEMLATFNLEVNRTKGADRAKVGEKYWRFVGVRIRIGTISYLTEIKDEDGVTGLNDIVVFRHWPGSPAEIGIPDPDYFTTGVGGRTEGVFEDGSPRGVIGFGFTDSSVTGDNMQGPDHIWVSADPPGAVNRRVGSDMISFLGWDGRTNHLHPDPIFQVATKTDGDNGTPPPGEVTGSTLRLLLDDTELYRGEIKAQTTITIG